MAWERKIPVPSGMVIRGMNVIYTLAYTVLNPLGLAAGSMAFVSGGLFGLLLLPVGTMYGLYATVLPEAGGLHDLVVYSMYAFVGWYLVTLVADDSHLRVEDACFRMPQNFMDRISYDYFLALFDYFPMTCVAASDRVKLDPDRQYILGGQWSGVCCVCVFCCVVW